MTSSDATSQKKRLIKHFIIVIRLILAVGIIALLIKLDVLDFQQFSKIIYIPGTIFVSLMLMATAVVLSVYRLKLLLNIKGIEISFQVLWHINYLSLFTNSFLPGGASGDITRAYYIANHAKKQITKGVLSVGIDRTLGLFALLVIAVSYFLFEPFSTPVITPLFKAGLYLTVSAIMVILITALVLIYGRRIGFVSWYETVIEQRPLLKKITQPLYEILKSYKDNPKGLFLCLALSFLIQGLTLSIIAMISINMELGDVRFAQYIIAGATGLLANVLPITPGGIGIAEGAFDQACRLLASHTTGSFGAGFLAFRMVSILFTLPGIFSFFKLFRTLKNET